MLICYSFYSFNTFEKCFDSFENKVIVPTRIGVHYLKNALDLNFGLKRMIQLQSNGPLRIRSQTKATTVTENADESRDHLHNTLTGINHYRICSQITIIVASKHLQIMRLNII